MVAYTACLYLPTLQQPLFQLLWLLLPLIVGIFFFYWLKAIKLALPLVVQLMLLTIGLLLGVGLSLFHWQSIEQSQLPATYQNQWITAEGTLWPDEQGWQLQTMRVNHRPLKAHLGLGKKRVFPAEAIGSHLTVGGVLKLPATPRFSGDFDDFHYRLAKHQQGVLLRMQVYRDGGRRFLSPWDSLQATVLTSVHEMRDRVALIFKQTLGAESGSLLGGIVLGDRAIQLPESTKEAFLKTGQIHLVAASGMNIAFVAGCLTLLLAFLPKNPFRLVKFGLISLGVGFYTLLTGLPHSIKRAATMWQLGIWVRGFNQQIQALNLLLLAITVLCLLDGTCVFSVGFQLSVLTTLGIITYTSWLERLGQRLRLPPWLSVAVMVTIAAQLWANPLILYYFHQIPLHATVFNAISSVLVAPLTMLGFLGTLGLGIHEGVTQACAWLASWGLQAMLAVTHWGASFTNALFKLEKPLPIPILIGFYGLLLAPVFWRLTQARLVFTYPPSWRTWLAQSPPIRSKVAWVATGAISCILLPIGFFFVQPFSQPKAIGSGMATVAIAQPKTKSVNHRVEKATAGGVSPFQSVYFLPLSASKSVYLLATSGKSAQTLAVLPAQFSARDVQSVSAFLFQKQLALPKMVIVLNAPPRTKRSAKGKASKSNPLAGLGVAKQEWGLSTVYTADSVAVKRAFSGNLRTTAVGVKTTISSTLSVKPQWCSHAKKERWQVCLLAMQGKHLLWLGNKSATQKVGWQKPANNLYQAITLTSSGIEIAE